MGNRIPPARSQPGHPFTEASMVFACEQGFVMSHRDRPEMQYFLRELTFSSEDSMLLILHQLQAWQHQKQAHDSMLTKLANLETIRQATMCGASYKIRLQIEYSTISINDEVETRRLTGRYLDHDDALRIVSGSIRALEEVQQKLARYEGLRSNAVINRVFVHPERILLTGEGTLRICSPLVVSPYDRLQHRNCCYYSPEKLADFDYPEDSKSALFELGVTLLEILTLARCNHIYNGFEVRQDLIDQKLHEIWLRYEDVLLCEMLARMTKVHRFSRCNMDQIVFLRSMLQQRMHRYQTEAPEGRDQLTPKYSEPMFSDSGLSAKNNQGCAHRGAFVSPAMIKSARSLISSSPALLESEDKQNEGRNSNVPSISILLQSEVIVEDNDCNQRRKLLHLMNESKPIGKESYQYGNHQGAELEGFQSAAKQQKGDTKFEWRRTRFNKNSDKAQNTHNRQGLPILNMQIPDYFQPESEAACAPRTWGMQA